MPQARLTKSVIDALPTPEKDTVYWDLALKGFGVKVTPKGRKVFIVLYRSRHGVLRKYTIGPYGAVTPHLARSEAQKVLAAKASGGDPAAERRDAKRRHSVEQIQAVAALFLERHASERRSGKELARVFQRDIHPVWDGRSIHEITKRDVVTLLTGIVDRGAPGSANKAFKLLRAFFNWCIGQALLERSPCEGLKLPSPEISRDRVLTDGELRAVWRAAALIGDPYGAIVKVLALTGQRREEVARMTWDEVNFTDRQWILPGTRTKNGRAHHVHLSDETCAVLGRLPRTSAYVFVCAQRPYAGFSQDKPRLDHLSGVSGWRLHDLRRTVVSGMARLGVAPHVADKILNHQSGAISGVAAVYQRHDFMAERRDALERWGRHVAELIS